LIIRGLEVKEGKRKEAVDELMKVIGVKMEIKEVWRVTAEKKKEREMVGIRIEDAEIRREILEKRRNLRGRRERIMEDWTWMERKMRWKLEEVARDEERKGKNVRLGYGRIKIDENWWRWDEEEEVLRDNKGIVRMLGKGEVEGGEKGEKS